jgi:hypothetical protein
MSIRDIMILVVTSLGLWLVYNLASSNLNLLYVVLLGAFTTILLVFYSLKSSSSTINGKASDAWILILGLMIIQVAIITIANNFLIIT